MPTISNRTRIYAAALIAALAAPAISLPAEAREPIRLEVQRFGPETTRELIAVQRSEQDVEQLLLEARNGELQIESLQVFFLNGQSQSILLNQPIREGDSPIVLQLRGPARLDRIEVTGRASRRSGGRAVLQVSATLDERRGPDRGGPDRGDRDGVPGRPLGELTIDRGFNREAIRVPRDRQDAERLVFAVRGGSIELRALRLTYRNGDQQTIEVGRELVPGERAFVVEPRPRSFVETVEVIAAARGRVGRGAILTVSAIDRNAGRDRPPAFGADRPVRDGWVLLGTKRAEMFSRDTDAFPVGQQAGRFRAIRIQAHRTGVRLYALEIKYGNGEVESYPLTGKLDAGETSPPIDLRGNRRFIEHIVLRYRSSFSLRGEGRVEVYGLRD